MKYLWTDGPRLLRSGRSKRKKVLFLDFDGTLAPISKHHDAAHLPPAMRHLLDRLKAVHRVVIISGRGLDDLKRRCGLKGIIYAGNHGLEIEGLHARRPAGLQIALKQARCIPVLAKKLQAAFRGFAGVAIENKRLTVTVHHRNLRPVRRRAFAAMIGICRKAFDRYPVIWRRGKRVWEIRPRHDWGKGDAVRTILRRFQGAFPIVIGDDKTDEDMFRVVGTSGWTIRVGRHRGSHARYYLRSTDDVKKFLSSL